MCIAIISENRSKSILEAAENVSRACATRETLMYRHYYHYCYYYFYYARPYTSYIGIRINSARTTQSYGLRLCIRTRRYNFRATEKKEKKNELIRSLMPRRVCDDDDDARGGGLHSTADTRSAAACAHFTITQYHVYTSYYAAST